MGFNFFDPLTQFWGLFLKTTPIFMIFSALQTIIKVFLNENFTFVWYVASNVSCCGLCNAREPIFVLQLLFIVS